MNRILASLITLILAGFLAAEEGGLQLSAGAQQTLAGTQNGYLLGTVETGQVNFFQTADVAFQQDLAGIGQGVDTGAQVAGFIGIGVLTDGLGDLGIMGGAAEETASGAESAINGVRLNQQLSAQSAFNASGGLSQEAIAGSTDLEIPLGNPAIPSDFSKFSTGTFDSPSGPFQVHFYMNPTTGEIWTGLDYKTVFNNPF